MRSASSPRFRRAVRRFSTAAACSTCCPSLRRVGWWWASIPASPISPRRCVARWWGCSSAPGPSCSPPHHPTWPAPLAAMALRRALTPPGKRSKNCADLHSHPALMMRCLCGRHVGASGRAPAPATRTPSDILVTPQTHWLNSATGRTLGRRAADLQQAQTLANQGKSL
ncbi:conserved exported hypothetical protein [Thiomonas sp. CB2]|nr:conserved exported hypothetical protein [Thiomonas sp. CB2]